MPTEAKTRCDKCHRPMEKARAVIGGLAVCPTCYYHYPKAPCSGCGINTRLIGPDGKPLCRPCRRIGRRCARCDKSLEEGGTGLITEEGAFCTPCSVHYRKPKPCPRCKRLSRRLSRDSKRGFAVDPVCEHCRREGNISCSVCRKDRALFAVTKDGKPICKGCAARGEAPFICPQCQQPGQYHSKKQCAACYAKSYAERHCREIWETFQHEWAKQAGRVLLAARSSAVSKHMEAVRVIRSLEFIRLLDENFSDPHRITAFDLIELFGRDGLRRFDTAHTVLTQQGIIPSYPAQELDDLAERVTQTRLIEKIGDCWSRPIMDRYYAYLLDIHARFQRSRRMRASKPRFVMRTITIYVRAVQSLLLWLPDKTHDIRGLDQDTLNRFMRENPGSVASLGRFVRYLNTHEKLFRKLEGSTPPTASPSFNLLSDATYKRLLRQWIQPDDKDLQWSLIGLLMLLFCQSKHKVSEMRLEQIFHDDKTGNYRIRFGRYPIDLDPRVSLVLSRWLKARRPFSPYDDPVSNPYLFPGRRAGSHITPAGISAMLVKEKVTAWQLFTTAVYKSYLNGVSSPKTLVYCYGLTLTTVMKYWAEFDPSLRDDINRMRERQAKSNEPA